MTRQEINKTLWEAADKGSERAARPRFGRTQWIVFRLHGATSEPNTPGLRLATRVVPKSEIYLLGRLSLQRPRKQRITR